MAYSLLFDPSGTLSELCGYSLFGDARFGCNGSAFFAPEIVAGDSQGGLAGTNVLWDADLSDGLDSDATAFVFDGNLATGSASMAVDAEGASPSAFDGGGTANRVGSDAIGSVLIRAGAQAPGSVTFEGLTLTFYKQGIEQEVVNLSGGPQATSADSSSGMEEQILQVTPGVSGCDRVVVTGSIRLQAAADSYLGWDDLFGQVLIMPAT
jgi:hypothetical protein